MEDLYTYLCSHKDEIIKFKCINERVNQIFRLTYDFYYNVLGIPKDKNKLEDLINKNDERIYKSFDCISLNIKISGYMSGLSIIGEDNLSFFLREVLDESE